MKSEFNRIYGEVHWQGPVAILHAIIMGATVEYVGSYNQENEQFSLKFPDGERLATVQLIHELEHV